LDNVAMSKMQQLESEIVQLSRAEQEELREWLENVLEDQLAMKESFVMQIEASERDMLAVRHTRAGNMTALS
jgi:hypothetical protein